MASTSESHAPRGISTEYENSGATAVMDERRGAKRILEKLPMMLTPLGRTRPVCCCSRDVSEGGVCVHMPKVSGLQVGQRCEVVFANEVGRRELRNCAGEARYATVVRTESLSEASDPAMGAALRFDQPLVL